MNFKPIVLATAQHPGGANAIAPVIQRLLQDDRVTVTTVATQHSQPVFDQKGIPYRTLADFGLAGGFLLDSARALIDAKKPRCVLTGTSGQDKENRDVLEQLVTYWARMRVIPSVAVLGMWEKKYARLFEDQNEALGSFLPDTIAAVDAYAREAMVKEGITPEHIVVTGNPYFDDLIGLKERFTPEDHTRIRGELGVRPDSVVVLFASQPIEFHYGQSFGYTEKDALKEVFDAVTTLPDTPPIDVVVKVHPRENPADLEAVVRNYHRQPDQRFVLDQKSPTRPALLASDIVISPFSTTLVESSYLERPSISLQPGLIGEDHLLLNTLGVTVPVYEKGQVRGIIRRIATNSRYVEHLSRCRVGFRTDGRATNRVTQLVYQKLVV